MAVRSGSSLTDSASVKRRELKYEEVSKAGRTAPMRIFRRPSSYPGGELRYGVRTREGRVVEFVVQLFGWVDGEWRLVAQFDHNPEMVQGHDVRSDGIHLDVFGPLGKRSVEVERHPGPLNPASGLDYAINYFTEHGERLIERYRGWENE